jgi:hypothetical protein
MGLWIRCGNENAVFTMGWKTFIETEEGTVDQVKHESHVDSFFDIKGVVHHKFLCQGQIVNCWYYLEVLNRLRENYLSCRETTPGSSLHHDNAPADALLLIHHFFGQHEYNRAS